MFFKKPPHRIFDYTPQFYKPEEDEELKERERKKRRLGFRRNLKIKKRNGKAFIYAVLFFIFVYFYLWLSGSL